MFDWREISQILRIPFREIITLRDYTLQQWPLRKAILHFVIHKVRKRSFYLVRIGLSLVAYLSIATYVLQMAVHNDVFREKSINNVHLIDDLCGFFAEGFIEHHLPLSGLLK